MSGSRVLACLAARAASDKQGEATVVLDVRDLISITDYFVITSGTSDRQVEALAEEVLRRLRERGVKPVREERDRDSRWVLLDYVDFVVHVFHEEDRQYYRLEALWADAPRVDWEEEAAAPVPGVWAR
ncbi:MAG TPA: ribosome silencing factor [Actinomycetota bacterium]|nr:ribosome silencing factor [Actinomycetota bacterium]